MPNTQINPNTSPPLIAAAEVGKHYSVTGRYILKLASEGKIPCLRLGVKCVRFNLDAVAEALERLHSDPKDDESAETSG